MKRNHETSNKAVPKKSTSSSKYTHERIKSYVLDESLGKCEDFQEMTKTIVRAQSNVAEKAEGKE